MTNGDRLYKGEVLISQYLAIKLIMHYVYSVEVCQAIQFSQIYRSVTYARLRLISASKDSV